MTTSIRACEPCASAFAPRRSPAPNRTRARVEHLEEKTSIARSRRDGGRGIGNRRQRKGSALASTPPTSCNAVSIRAISLGLGALLRPMRAVANFRRVIRASIARINRQTDPRRRHIQSLFGKAPPHEGPRRAVPRPARLRNLRSARAQRGATRKGQGDLVFRRYFSPLCEFVRHNLLKHLPVKLIGQRLAFFLIFMFRRLFTGSPAAARRIILAKSQRRSAAP